MGGDGYRRGHCGLFLSKFLGVILDLEYYNICVSILVISWFMLEITQLYGAIKTSHSWEMSF